MVASAWEWLETTFLRRELLVNQQGVRRSQDSLRVDALDFGAEVARIDSSRSRLRNPLLGT